MIGRLLKTVLIVIPLVSGFAEWGSAQGTSQMMERERAIHVLNRLTFGARPGDVDEVIRVGVDRWIDRQLNPESIRDVGGARALARFTWWTEPLDSAMRKLATIVTMPFCNPAPCQPGARPGTVQIILGQTTVSSRKDALELGPPRAMFTLTTNRVVAGRIALNENSDQQLLEVMSNFWENHFSIYGAQVFRESYVDFVRTAIRPNAMGKFRELLGAVVKSPAMLGYLDNALSAAEEGSLTLTEAIAARKLGVAPELQRATGLNENFARELLELHTLGVEGGYTQGDVNFVARAFTGWTHTRSGRDGIMLGMERSPFTAGEASVTLASFRFDSLTHDAHFKTILGRDFAPARGMEDGEEVLDILARHPSTAKHIARKLAVRFVSDVPPQSLVDRAAETFLRTDGDIREVVRTIVTSAEFFAADTRAAKVKSPYE